MVFDAVNDKTFPEYEVEKIFSNRTRRSKVMTKFQFICKCYAITCNTCKVHVYSFFVLWFVHSKLCQFLTESLQNFKGGRWQTNFRLPKYYVINIFKLEYLRYILSDWDQTCFVKSRMTVSFISEWITFLNFFWSRKHDVIKLSIADISLILHSIDSQSGHRSQDSPWCHIKYYVTLKVTLTFGVNGKVNAYSFLSLDFSIHYSVNSWPNFFKLSTVVVDKETSGWIGITSSLYLN